MANALDVLSNFLGQDAPLLTGNAPNSGMGLYYNPQTGGQPKRPKQSNMGSAIDTIRQQFPGNSVSDTAHGHETGMMNSGQEEQQKKSFWQSPGGSILGTLLTTLGTAGVGAGLGALSGGRRGAGQGAAMGGGMAFLNDLMMRKAAAQTPANEAKQLQDQQELAYKQKLLESQGEPTSVKEFKFGLDNPDFATQLKQQQAAKQSDLTAWQKYQMGETEKKKGEPQIQGESAFRQEFMKNPVVKDTQDATIGMNKIENAAKDINKSGFNDMALIFNYMKVLDPGSTVREGEYKTASNNAPLLQRLGVSFEKVSSGQQLSPEQRQLLIQAARNQYQAHLDSYNTYKTEMTGIAQQYGFNPERIAPSFGAGQVGEKPNAQMQGGEQSAPQADPRAAAIAEAKRRGIWKEP